MAGPVNLDSDTSAWLAGIDPSLALLPVAVPKGDGGLPLQPHDVCWTPGEGCRLAYQLRSPGSPTEFLAVAVSADSWTQFDFRDDPALPGLRFATEPASVAGLLAPVLGGRAASVRIEPVRYRPGLRCVLRYDVETSAGVQTLYAKVLPDDTFDRLAPLATALDGVPMETRVGPPLVAVWPQLRTLVLAGVAGPSAAAVLRDPTLSAVGRAHLAHRIGDLLARLHTLDAVDAPEWTAADQIAALRDARTAASLVDNGLGDRLTRLLDRLAEHPPTPGTGVLSHGGFRAGQVVVGASGTLVLLDMDGCCISDRGRDLGTAMAQLFWRAVLQPAQYASLHELEDALLAGYRSRAPATSLESLEWWRAVGLLQVAVRRYRRLETLDWPSVPLLVDAAELLVDHWESRPAPITGADLMDVRAMSVLLGPLLGDRGTAPDTTAIDSARQLAVAEGRRVVVSYSARAADGAPAVPVIGKAFTELARAELLDQHLRLLHDGPFHGGGFRVPEPLGVLSAQRMVLFRHFEGTPLSDVTEPQAAEHGVRLAGQWLARLHASDVRLPRELSLEQEAAGVRQWAAVIGRSHPDLGSRAELLAACWVAAARSVGFHARVPIHKDFHAGHVLVGEQLCVVDLDEARLGDPALDVAHFCTYLQAVGADEGTRSLRAVFLEAYADAAGWSDQGSFRPFCAYTWLKIAKQRAAGSGLFPAATPEARRSGVERAIDEGERCLDP